MSLYHASSPFGTQHNSLPSCMESNFSINGKQSFLKVLPSQHLFFLPLSVIPLRDSVLPLTLRYGTQTFLSVGRNPFLQVMLLLALPQLHLNIQCHSSVKLSTIANSEIWDPTLSLCLGRYPFLQVMPLLALPLWDLITLHHPFFGTLQYGTQPFLSKKNPVFQGTIEMKSM